MLSFPNSQENMSEEDVNTMKNTVSLIYYQYLKEVTPQILAVLINISKINHPTSKGAEKQINIDGSITMSIEKRLNNPDRTIFNDAQRAIQDLMLEGSLPKFLKSRDFTIAQGLVTFHCVQTIQCVILTYFAPCRARHSFARS